MGLCLCWQMVSVASPRGSSGQWDCLPSVCAMAGSPCCGQQQDPCPPSLAVTWQHKQPLSRWGLLQHCGLQKFALGTSVSFHFHCNKILQCAVIGTDLLLRLTKTWKPGEAPWEENVCNLDFIPLLEKNLSLYLSPCKDSANVLALLRGTKEGSEDISCAVLDISVLLQGPLQHVWTLPCF